MITIPAQFDKANRYREAFAEACRNLPPPGGGCHNALLGAANHGAMAGLSEADIFAGLRAGVKPGARRISDREIQDAISKAMTGAPARRISRPSRPAWTPTAKVTGDLLKQNNDRALALRERLIAAGGGEISPFAAEIWESSSPHPGAGFEQFPAPTADALLFLQELYQPDDFLYIGTSFEKPGEMQSQQIKTAWQWTKFFLAILKNGHTIPFPFFCANPLKGAPDDNGRYRTDSQTKAFKYCVLEIDKLPLEKQAPLMRGLRLPIVSLSFSGGKSIHALMDVSKYNNGSPVRCLEEWDAIIKQKLFPLLEPLGFDGATKNPSRLSRLPGVFRAPKNLSKMFADLTCWQMQLYLNRKGEALAW